ncbi:hypothetical protein QGN29_02370 [Temperatibacter marinus]|uniref:Uncharacterized protein n=1 Tax=Temperatibacter marinus TaxID=1456591 RepID=A0AA52ED24_9PROT|nr:hypothetical protein [Temperatibacter marinus]WND03212.1 hypothetical protein QGN29_02370 [Temperatibacter marinus]
MARKKQMPPRPKKNGSQKAVSAQAQNKPAPVNVEKVEKVDGVTQVSKGLLESESLIVAIRYMEKLHREEKPLDAYAVLLKILKKLEGNDWHFGEKGYLERSDYLDSTATRLAQAMIDLVFDESVPTRVSVLLNLCRYRRTISQVFEISGYRGTNIVIERVKEYSEVGQYTINKDRLIRALHLLSINALTLNLLPIIRPLQKEVVFSLLLGYLSEQMLYAENVEEVRTELLKMLQSMRDVPYFNSTLGIIGPAYMGCSYAQAEFKHDVKYAINDYVSNWLKEADIHGLKTSAKRPMPEKPTIVIFAELYNSKHAMHRCYGPSIKALKENYHTVLFIEENCVDDLIIDMVDEIDTTKFDSENPKALFDKIKSYKPDILYYPSIGMRLSSIACSNVRLAPIQVMTFGHPASTRSKYVDYVILAEGQLGHERTLTEKVYFRLNTTRHVAREDLKIDKYIIRPEPEKIRIAVPAWSRKVSPDFLEVCKKLHKQSKRPVEFVFFPNAKNALFQSLRQRLEKDIPDTRVVPTTSYEDYISNLNKCDIFMSTFPFGATNSIMDASIQGLPVVNLQGDEVHSYNDSHLLERINQPKWLTASTIEEYYAAMIKLIDNDKLRVKISRNIIDGKPKEAFFRDKNSANEDMLKAMNDIYYNHEMIMASDKKTWKYTEFNDESVYKEQAE